MEPGGTEGKTLGTVGRMHRFALSLAMHRRWRPCHMGSTFVTTGRLPKTRKSIDGRLKCLRVLWLVVFAAPMALLGSVVLAAPSQAFNEYYCQQYVAGYNACSRVAVGYFNVNHAYVPGASFGGVCEKVTQLSGYVVSRRCSNTDYASSDPGYCEGDLWGYYPTYELVGYAGNNQNVAQYIVGHAYVEDECA
jgi:hypothetical protein